MAKAAGMSSKRKVVADNRRARFDYFIEEVFEAGIVLTGTEVKSLREGRASLAESYVGVEAGELFLINAHVPEYHGGNKFNHAPRRHRKLLLKRREVGKLAGAIQRQGLTIVALKIYFNQRGLAKVEIALARGKKLHDKRQTQKDRSWQREKGRLLRDRG